MRASKGVHLVVPRSAIDAADLAAAGGQQAGLILRTPTSVLFVIPWGERWIVGTTDTPWRLDRDHPAACSTDIGYILDQVNRVLVRPVTPDQILGVYAGLRPLLAGESDETSRLSREHAVVTPVPGLVLVAGGKYTTYRVMAEDAVDAAVAGLPGVPASRTAHLPLVGRAPVGRRPRRGAAAGRRLGPAGGGRSSGCCTATATGSATSWSWPASDPALARPLTGAPDYLAAEVVHAVTAEGALHLDDVLTRRTRVSIETAHRGVESAPRGRRADGRGARLGRRAHRPRGRALHGAGGGGAGVAADARRPHRGRRPARRARRARRRCEAPRPATLRRRRAGRLGRSTGAGTRVPR